MNTLSAYETRVGDPADVEAAYVFCENLVRGHYENFPVASRLLFGRARRAIAALYGFARLSDDFADEPEYEGVRLERLDEWRRELSAVRDGGAPGHPVFVALRDAAREFDLPLGPFEDLLNAFTQDVTKKRYESFAEVLDYCRRSANPVGRIVLMVHGYRDPELFRMSDAICTGLQLANFWQDMSVDLKKDRIYIPREDFDRFGYSEGEMFRGVVNDALRRLTAFEVVRARGLFAEGRALPSKLSWPLSWEIALTLRGGLAILDKIEAQGFATLDRRPVLGKLDWLGALCRKPRF
jgi:phytoene synthase